MDIELIKKSLLSQLARKKANLDHFNDIINDYAELWKIKTKLAEDIDSRGVVYKDFSSVGIEMQKNNPSVKEFVNVNKQMLSLLKELGINTNNVIGDDDDKL